MIPLSKLGVSSAKEKQFRKKGITCAEELASFFPRKYQDYREKKAVKDLRDGDICRVSGVITNVYDDTRFVITLDDRGYCHHMVRWLLLQKNVDSRLTMDLLREGKLFPRTAPNSPACHVCPGREPSGAYPPVLFQDSGDV